MDSIYNWMLNAPEKTMNTKIISCGYEGSSEVFNISGELYGGVFLLIGFRTGVYASITAYSYWKERVVSIASIENGAWTKRFEKIITNNDLLTRFDPIRISGNSGETFASVLKDKSDNSVKFIAFSSPSDNPFSFEAGYAITFHSGVIHLKNVITLFGISYTNNPQIEARRINL